MNEELKRVVNGTLTYLDPGHILSEEQWNDIKILRSLAEQVLSAEWPEKAKCNKHKSATDTPRGTDYCVSCCEALYYNTALDLCRLAAAKDKLKWEESEELQNYVEACVDAKVQNNLKGDKL